MVTRLLVIVLGCGLCSALAAQEPPAAPAWSRIAPYFQPPAEFAGQFGDLPSPLKTAAGQPITTADQWSERRKELFATWTQFLGPWPAVLEAPKVEYLSEETRDGIVQKRVRVEIAPNQTGEGWLLIPPGKKPLPAALVVFYEPETSIGLKGDKPDRDLGWQLAKRGIATLNIGTPGGNAYKPEIGQAVCQPLSFHAYVAANCWQAMSHMPEIDKTRIGIVGHSYGGKWSMFGGALWDKFAVVAVSDPGIVFDEARGSVNYWEPWYLGLDASVTRKPGIPKPDNPTTGAYKQLRAAGHDLHEIHALICPRPFFVSGGSEDTPKRWTALNHSIAVNKLLGVSDRIGMTNRPDHSPNAQSNAALMDFFTHFLIEKPVH
ncbi:MAG: sialidase [Pirellulaceae bacterium]|nr:sialidase [Pirellulaceae bacterium]